MMNGLTIPGLKELQKQTKGASEITGGDSVVVMAA
jgi:hypothetical protein